MSPYCGCGRTTLIRLEARSRSRADTSLCALHFTSLPTLIEPIAGNPDAPTHGPSVRLLAVCCSNRGSARNLRAEGIAGVLLE
jgi:hypothetical protein